MRKTKKAAMRTWIAVVRTDAPLPDYEIRVRARTWSEANRLAGDAAPFLTTSIVGVRAAAPKRKR